MRDGLVQATPEVEDLLRELAPRVLGVIARRFGDFDGAEDAVQEALLAAARHWPREGVPESPRAWLVQTAQRRMTDQLRSEQSGIAASRPRRRSSRPRPRSSCRARPSA